ncbi:MAG: pyridine nucleotide-disulfide oxidoreductase [Deltaproteobacteria bacterium RBG_13_43_22]|nr:MAG: pyridine nucleotide-disulfide oxidoreductase [Deltaproteobacteria bacterium RBG_13_43_22]
MNYVIIGNGVAGTTAAENIRKNDPQGEIKIFTDEAYPFYSRIRLIEYLAGEVELPKLQIRSNTWYDDQKIQLFLNRKVVDIDTDKKVIVTQSGERHGYDKLLLADGSHSFVPPIKGAEKKGVFTLRNLKDAQEIKSFANGKTKALLIGGGILGIEVGNSLRKTGLKVSVIEFAPRLLPRQTDPVCAGMLQTRLEQMGLTFYLGVASKEIIGENQVQGLLLEDGRQIETDLIIISAGVRPNLELAQKLNLKIGKGIPVSDHLETEIPNIYAAGDSIEHKGMLYGIWPASEKQGEVAGMNMAGNAVAYTGTTFSNLLKVAGIDLLAAGDIDPDGKLEAIVDQNPEAGTYRKLVIKENLIVGCLLFGTLEGRKNILKAMEEKRNIASVKERLARFDLEVLN